MIWKEQYGTRKSPTPPPVLEIMQIWLGNLTLERASGESSTDLWETDYSITKDNEHTHEMTVV